MSNIPFKTLKPSRWLALLGPDNGPLRQIFSELAEYLQKLPQYTEKIADLYGTAWTNGQLAYDKATKKTHQWDGTQWLQQLHSSLDSWTPSVDQGANINIAKTTRTAKYTTWGKLCYVVFSLDLTAAGAAGSRIQLTSLPKTPDTSGNVLTTGTAQFYDASVPRRYHCAVEMDATSLYFIHDTSVGDGIGASPAVTIASGDIIRGFALYPFV